MLKKSTFEINDQFEISRTSYKISCEITFIGLLCGIFYPSTNFVVMESFRILRSENSEQTLRLASHVNGKGIIVYLRFNDDGRF